MSESFTKSTETGAGRFAGIKARGQQNPFVQYGAFDQTTSNNGSDPSLHPHGQKPVQGFDMNALVQAMLQGQLGQIQARGSQQREARNPVHRNMSGGIIDPTTGKTAGNPFDNGTFIDNKARAGREQQVLGGNSDGVFDPNGGHFGQTGRELTHHGPLTVMPQSPLSTPMPMPGGGMQGMINPFAPDASKYADSNIWTAQGSARQVQPQPPVGPPPQLGTGYGLDQPQSLTPSPIGTKPAMRPGMSFGFSMSPRRTYAM